MNHHVTPIVVAVVNYRSLQLNCLSSPPGCAKHPAKVARHDSGTHGLAVAEASEDLPNEPRLRVGVWKSVAEDDFERIDLGIFQWAQIFHQSCG